MPKLDNTGSTPSAPTQIFLSDYRPPAWVIRRAEVEFDLDPAATEVTARLHVEPNAENPGPLVLDGEGLELLSLQIDGKPLAADRYRQTEGGLTIEGLTGACVVETRVRIHPEKNTQLEGLYASRGLLITQCEAEGFRRITFFQDRPDVMPTWKITLRADADQFPVLLGNGNPHGVRKIDGGRHEAVWENPHPTPAYLFAVVAGRLENVHKDVTTGEGRTVRLAIWAAPNDIPRCDYALGALERSLRWDEQRFGRFYDLDVYNLVAVQDFTMGAMENKGLNVFNARYVLADTDTATDHDYLAIEAVIGHEYFHNWSGNRVTLREWFQLSLKEGFTVFRDQEFTSDLHSRAVKRIEDVRQLRARQFAEDAGALAHPVRPDSYREINNFYTATVYEKGAELVRMLHTLLGEETFRRGCDKYFADNDGRAATVEDFLAALAAASGRGLEHFARWYRQAGTPEVRITEAWDAERGTYTLTLTQSTPPTPSQPEKLPVTVPLRFCLYGTEGAPLTVPPAEAPVRDEGNGQMLFELVDESRTLRFEGLWERPLPSFNQGFGAPVKVDFPYSPADLGRLAAIDGDSFNRWEALQRLVVGILLHRFEQDAEARQALSAAVGNLLDDPDADPHFVAECLNLPGFETLAEMAPVIDVDDLLGGRERLLHELAATHAERLARRYAALADAAAGGLEGPAMAARALRNACLGWMARLDPAPAQAQFEAAQTMTDRIAALGALVRFDAPGKETALQTFRERYRDDPLVTDKWLGLVATRPHPDALGDVRALLDSPWWLPTNPNRVRAVLGTFSRMNPTAFHRADGEGYRLLAERLPAQEKINAQVAARLLGAFESWRRLAGDRKAQAEAALRTLDGKLTSRECTDLLGRLL